MDNQLKKGTLILTISLIISMNPWFWFFTIFPFIYGMYLVWSSKSATKLKFLCSVIPILLGIVLVILFYNLYMIKKSF